MIECPVCGATVARDAVRRHVSWHIETDTLLRWRPSEAVDQAEARADIRATFAQLAGDQDEAPTQKFPALGGPTVFRRPPPPPVRELRGPELLRAIAEELAAYDDEDDQGSAQHFHGCPTPTGRPFDCDYCQKRAASMGDDQ